MLIYAGICMGTYGCAKRVIPPAPSPSGGVSVPTGIPGKRLEDLSPRARASLRLTEQGRKFLESGKPDDAIRMLEQAINLDVTNGLNYFYMSEAWLFKGNFQQAEEFNGLAQIYLKESPGWVDRVMDQKDRIEKLSE